MVRRKKRNGTREILESVATIAAAGAAIVSHVRPLMQRFKRKYRKKKGTKNANKV